MSIELLRKAGPVQNSVHDLIQTLSIKIDSVARLGRSPWCRATVAGRTPDGRGARSSRPVSSATALAGQ
jgi:hypothetical protein